jgi:uridine kinase
MQTESDRITRQLLPNDEKYEPFTRRLDSLLSKGMPVVLAIDGRAASGKSSLTEKLARDYPARVIHMDDFYLPIELRTVERLAEPGGNLHYERFMTDVLPGLRKQEGFSYQAFDCAVMNVGEWRNLFPAQLTIVEGAYAMHPKLGAYYDLALFLSCAPETQLARIKKRNPAKSEQFRKHWIPLEEAYFKAFGIPELADLIIQT